MLNCIIKKIIYLKNTEEVLGTVIGETFSILRKILVFTNSKVSN